MPLKGVEGLSSGGVPQVHRLVARGPHNGTAVRRELRALKPIRMPSRLLKGRLVGAFHTCTALVWQPNTMVFPCAEKVALWTHPVCHSMVWSGSPVEAFHPRTRCTLAGP